MSYGDEELARRLAELHASPAWQAMQADEDRRRLIAHWESDEFRSAGLAPAERAARRAADRDAAEREQRIADEARRLELLAGLAVLEGLDDAPAAARAALFGGH